MDWESKIIHDSLKELAHSWISKPTVFYLRSINSHLKIPSTQHKKRKCGVSTHNNSVMVGLHAYFNKWNIHRWSQHSKTIPIQKILTSYRFMSVYNPHGQFKYNSKWMSSHEINTWNVNMSERDTQSNCVSKCDTWSNNMLKRDSWFNIYRNVTLDSNMYRNMKSNNHKYK